MESRALVLMNIFAGQEWRLRHRELTYGHGGGRRGWRELREQHWNVYIAGCTTEGWGHSCTDRWRTATEIAV